MDDLFDIQCLEYCEYFEKRRRRIVKEQRISDLDFLDEIDFKNRYRLNKSTVEYIINKLDGALNSASTKNNPLNSADKILLALRYFACGAFQSVIGDLQDISQPSTCRAINEVAKGLAELRAEYIQLPQNEAERVQVSQKFYQHSGFPGVYGALDCTHIPIISTGGNSAELFRCRKGYFSLNVQTLSDASLYIRNIVACWPGSTHDSTIFDNSSLRAMLEAGEIPASYHVLGDNGYGCRSYLLTPFLDPSNPQQKRYNDSHILARNTVERQYGIWKRRFSCLSIPLRCNLENSMAIIVATGVLHNMALAMGDDFENEEYCDSFQDEPIIDEHIGGIAKRNLIVNNYFS